MERIEVKKEHIQLNSMKQIQNKMGKYTFGLTVFALFIIVFAVTSTVYMRNQDAESTQNYINNYTQQVTETVVKEIENKKIIMQSLIEALERPDWQNNKQAFMDRKRHIFNIDFMAFCDENNKIVVSSGNLESKQEAISNVQGISTFKEVIKNDGYAVGIANGYVLYATKFLDSDNNISSFWMINKEENIRNIIVLKTLKTENSASFLIDKNGYVLVSSLPRFEDKRFDQILNNKYDLNEKLDYMKNKLSYSKSGIFSYESIGSNNYYLSFIPAKINDWVTVTVMPVNLFTSYSDNYVRVMTFCISAMIVIFSLALVFLYLKYFQTGNKLEKLAYRDDITGGINRTKFRMIYYNLVKDNKLTDYTLIFMDFVGFKLVNESFGDKAGDKILKYIYIIINSFLKTDEYVSRTELDHFYILMLEKDRQIIELRMKEILGKISTLQNTTLIPCNIDFRLSAYDIDKDNVDFELLQDYLVAVIKHQTINDIGNLIYFDKSLSDKLAYKRKLDSEFLKSIENEDFEVYLQPKVNINTGKVIGAEALVRWILPNEGIVPPIEFIPLFEHNGKICQLDKYVFNKVCSLLQKWKNEGKKLFPISVNLSRCHFLNENFFDDYLNIMDNYNLDHSLIEFELTESILLEAKQIKKVKEDLKMIQDKGFRCSIDDFGVGCSSLTVLREFSINSLKLDKSFFKQLNDDKAWIIVAKIVEIANKLKIALVAEGIETQEQIDYLKKLSCEIVQGFYYSRPLKIEEFEKWIDNFEHKYIDM